MEDRRLTQDSQSGRGGRAASLVVVALLLILLVATSSAGAATTKASPIRLGALPPQQAHADRPFDAQLNVTGGVPPYTYELSGDLPEGLSLTESGELVGEPSLAGSFWFGVTVRDREGNLGTRRYTLKIGLTVPSMHLDLWVGGMAAAPLEVLGGRGANVFKVPPKDLPPGMAFYQEVGGAYLSGTPTKTGSYTFPVTVTDRFSKAKGTATDTVHVWGSPFPVALHTFRESSGPSIEGQLFTPEAEANGVISGTTTVIEGGEFTYDINTEMLHIFPADSDGAEYFMSCEPARSRCSGNSRHGEASLTV